MKDHQGVFDSTARDLGVESVNNEHGQHITAQSKLVLVEGVHNSHGTFIEFSRIDSPKAQGSEEARFGVVPTPPPAQRP
ncbi:MAG TPA: hypothetical protein VFE47_14460 [Tepidisphaeraceae bacterium]|nr:hypothetical protein [Tepidisphaeraceae bacterium]